MALNTPPILTNKPALVRALIALLISQPERTAIPIEADSQEYTRAACRRAIAEALRAYARQNPDLLDRYPNLADFTKYTNESALLADAWLAVNEFISAQLPERNLPTREQLEYWMNQRELNRLERLAANPNKDNPWRAETLTLEQMQQLWEASRRWDEVRLRIQQAAAEAVINDLPPEVQTLARKNESLQTLTDISAYEATQRLAADVQVGAKSEPPIVIESLEHFSPATNVVTATSSGRSTFRQGITEALQAPASVEQLRQAARVRQQLARAAAPSANQLIRQIQAATGVDQAKATKIFSIIEQKVTQNQPYQTALTEALAELHLEPDKTQAAYNALAAATEDYGDATQALRVQSVSAVAGRPVTEQFVRRLSGAANISRDQAIRINQHLEQAIRLGQSYQAALLSSLSGLGLSPEQLDQISANLTPLAKEYTILVQTSLPPSPTAAIPLTTIHAFNERSLAENGPIITHTTLEFHQRGVGRDAFTQALGQSPHRSDFNPELITQTQVGLDWLNQHPELMEQYGLAAPALPLERFVLEVDARPWGSTEYFQHRFQIFDQQLATRNAQGITGWLKAPGLKWQAGWAKFAANHAKLAGFAGFVASPKAFITNKVGGWLAGKGLRWLTKSAAGKTIGGLLTKIGGKLAGKGLAKLLGGAVGTLIGGPVGTVAGIAFGFILEKAGGWLGRNLKKIAAVLAAFLALLIGLIAKLAAIMPALLTAAGLYILPFNPLVGSLMLGGGLFGLAKQAGAWLGKGGIPNLLSNVGSSIGNFLGLSTTATVPAYITAAPLVAIGGLAVVSIFTTMTLTSAFVLPPTEEQPPGLSDEAGNIVEFTCDHPACKIADIVQAYAGGVLTQNTWTMVVDTLLRDNLSEATVSELERSANSFYSLQCVGFKIAVEKELGINLPHQNAVAFLYNHPGCTEVSKDQAQYGDNAVWGAQSGCPATSPQEANSLCGSNSACCGHIGVITKTIGNQKIYVTSANASGNGSVDTREFTRYNVDTFIRCQ